MNKKIETKWNNEVKDWLDTAEELGVLKEQANQEVEEETNIDIELSELWQYDNEWNFQIKENIQWEDEKWKYIEVRWQKYYENILNWLEYSITRDSISNSDLIYLWPVKEGKPEWYWNKYTQRYSYVGLWNKSIPVSWKLTKFYKNWTIESEYNWNVDTTFNPKWNWICKYYPSWVIYEWEFKDWIRNGKWKCTYNDGATYEWEWKNWKREWHWIYTYQSWKTYEWEWNNNKFQEWEWIMTRTSWEQYKWYILIDDDGNPQPFYKIYQKYIKRHQDLWDTELLNKNMEWKFTLKNGYHEYRLTNWSISEKTNDFITMYWDKKPDENRSEERGEILYIVNYRSESHIEYKVTSWKWRSVKRKFNWTEYVFKDDEWQSIISIPASSEFWEKEALHAGNLINGARYFNETAHGNGAYRFDDDDNLRATTTATHWYSSWWGISYHEISHEANWTRLIKEVKKHFWWVDAWALAKWLNNAKWVNNKEK